MMKRLTLLIALLLSGCSNVLYTTALSGLVVDYGQTRSIARKDLGEGNPILGPHPTVKQVDAYFPVMIAATALSPLYVKPDWQPYFYGGITLLEAVCIGINMKNGVHMDFVGVKW